MSRALVVPLLLAFALAPGCTCNKAAPVTGETDGGFATPSASEGGAPVIATGEAAHFSAPIAAARVGGGGVLVAGLVVPDKTIVVTRLEATGTTFSVTALRGVAWSQDAELRVYAADGGGGVVVWRGPRDGKSVRQMVAIGKGGELKGEPVDIGAVACATEDGLAWTERASAGKSKVMLKGWSQPAREIATIGAEREPVVVCGAHRVYALGQGEDDMTFATSEDGGARRMVLASSDFGSDEEREIAEYSVGDELGVVRVGSGGQVAVREAKADGLGAWKRLTTVIPADDDLVAVDADAKATYLITTRESAGACGDGSSSVPSSVQVLRVDRATLAETSAEVAPAECGKELGPFWTGTAGGRFVVAWAERAGKRDAFSAPIAGLAYRALGGAEPSAVVHVTRAADALVDAGCDKDRCYAVALVRSPNTTNLVPELVQSIAYP